MARDFEYYCCVRLVSDTSSVFGRCEFSVDFHSAQYDDWNWAAMLLCLDCRCQHPHCTETFRIHSMLMSVADDDCSGRRFWSNVANDNVDGADCKLVHWFWFVEDLQSIKMYSIFVSISFLLYVLFRAYCNVIFFCCIRNFLCDTQ